MVTNKADAKRVTISQTVLPLPGSLDETPCFNSNSPEIVSRPGILLSTFPGEGKAFPDAHLNHPLQGRISVFFHHITDAQKTGKLGKLYLGLIVGNASEQKVTLRLSHSVSYMTNPDAPFRRFKSVEDNDAGQIYAGPGDRVALDLLSKRKDGMNSDYDIREISLDAGEIKLLSSLPLPVNPLLHPLNGRTGYLTLNCDGPVYLANLALFAHSGLFENEQAPDLQAWQDVLEKQSLVEPRDRAPSTPGAPGELIYGRVAGITTGSQWNGTVINDVISKRLSLAPGQILSYPISTVSGGTFGTGQVQAAPLLARYSDTAYQSNGNYGVLYELLLPIYNGSEHEELVGLTLQSPLKDWHSQDSLQFFEAPPEAIMFRGTIKFVWQDQNGAHRKLIHLVHRRGQRINPIAQLKLAPSAWQELKLSFYYPADCTPPQVLTIAAQKTSDVHEMSSKLSVISSELTFPSGGSDMGWLDRLFGHHDAAPAQQAPAQQAPATAQATIPPERVGLNGEYDQSGLAKRVAKAFDEAGFDDHQTVWIAQTGTTVVLKGKCHDQDLLNKMVGIAKNVHGAGAVETNQVTVGK